MTSPSATARIGVPMGPAMSTPACSVPHRAPKLEVWLPTAGRTNRGRRAASSRAARSSLKRWPLASRLENCDRSLGSAMLRTWGACEGAAPALAESEANWAACGTAVAVRVFASEASAASAISEVAGLEPELLVAACPAATTAPAATAKTAARPLSAVGEWGCGGRRYGRVGVDVLDRFAAVVGRLCLTGVAEVGIAEVRGAGGVPGIPGLVRFGGGAASGAAGDLAAWTHAVLLRRDLIVTSAGSDGNEMVAWVASRKPEPVVYVTGITV